MTRYHEHEILILDGRDAVRARPAMYFSSTGPDGLLHYCLEMIASSLESIGNEETDRLVIVTLHEDDSLTVENSGPGIAAHEDGDASKLTEFFTSLAPRPWPDRKRNYQLSQLGMAPVSFTSEWLEAESCHAGRRWTMRLEKGLVASGPLDAGATEATGLLMRALFDRSIFEAAEGIDFGALLKRCRPLALADPRITLKFEDRRTGKTQEMAYPGGAKQRLLERVDVPEGTVLSIKTQILFGEGPGSFLDIAMAFGGWSAVPTQELYVDGYEVPEGGVTIDAAVESVAVRGAAAIECREKESWKTRDEAAQFGAMTSRSLSIVMVLDTPNPQFAGVWKHRLINHDLAAWVRGVVLMATPRRVCPPYDAVPAFWRAIDQPYD